MTPSSPTSRSSGANARLLVLAALRRQPNHGYEIQRMIELSRTSHWARVLPGSIYHALKALAAEGLISGQGAAPRGSCSRREPMTHLRGRLHPLGRTAVGEALRDDAPLRLLLQAIVADGRGGVEGGFEVARFEHPFHGVGALAPDAGQTVCLQFQGAGAEAGARSTLIPAWQAALLRNGHAHLTADIALIEEIARLAAGAAPPDSVKQSIETAFSAPYGLSRG